MHAMTSAFPLAAAVLLGAVPAQAQEPIAVPIVAAQRTAAGNPAGVRSSNAKGICVKGSFTPSAGAAALSKAPFFAQATPFTGRFAMGGGNPKIADTVKGATRGFSIRLEHSAGETSLLFISTPMFLARTPQQMLDFLTVRLPGPGGQPDAEKIRAFSAANPNTLAQGAYLASHPVPASFAGINSWAVQAYTLTNAKNEATVVKFKTVPQAGTLDLTEEEVKAKPADFYAADLKDRLAKGAVGFDLVAIIGQSGDVTNDSTATWPEEQRRAVKLGVIAVKEIVPDATCNAFTFDPVSVPPGIAGPADDPMFEIRSLAYAVSFGGRQ